MRADRRSRLTAAFALVVTAAAAGSASAEVDDPFPATRPANRLQALAILGGGIHAPEGCPTLRVQALASSLDTGGPAARRALATLRRDASLPAEQKRADAWGNVFRYTLDRGSLDRVEPAETPDGIPPAVLAAKEAIEASRNRLVVRLDLPEPAPLDIVLAHLGSGARGLFLAGEASGRSGTIWIPASAGSDLGAIRAAVVHQYAHAVADRLGLGPAWAEALAGWLALDLPGDGSAAVESAVSERMRRLAEGIPTDDATLALGNAAWLAWLHDAKGATAMRVGLQELSATRRFEEASERTLRRVDGTGFAEGLRDFHLWSVLVGSRDDGRHFPFAARLADPAFAATFDGLPALSIQASPAVAGGGATQAVARPGVDDGGVTVRFEGEFGGRWECDLLLRSASGGLHRLALPLDAEGRGEVTVPAASAREVVLLVRNLDAGESVPRRYTWTAFREPGYPVEYATVSAAAIEAPAGAVSVRWETASERDLVGFHVLRAAAGGGEFRRVHAVWVPAVGTVSEGALYEFLDFEATPGLEYVYRVEAITEDGLVSPSAPVPLSLPASRPR